ncbi:MAG: S-layer homology domain-containing protein [Clostridiaceae bacterium]|nr:S-layer homology domain-containing protein [Clostridiaceae bacterium]
MNIDKKLLRCFMYIVLVALIIGQSSFPVHTQEEQRKILSYSGGSGTPNNPYLISTLKDLMDLSEAGLYGEYGAAYYKLTENIDLGENIWNPIGSHGPMFNGIFDGNGKTITIRKIADNSKMGLFSITDSRSVIKNLIVNAQINQTLAVQEEVTFGLITGFGGGSIENCVTEGSVYLTVNGSGRFCFGGGVGKLEGSIDSMMNKAALTLQRIGEGELNMGGIIGSAFTEKSKVLNLTNQGNIAATYEGFGMVGGIAGFFGFGAKAENLLNQGEITVKVTRVSTGRLFITGGIIGELRESDLDKALNKGNIYSEYSGPFVDEELIAAGIAGTSERTGLRNVGNEGNVETRTARIQLAIGITWSGREVTVKNAYSRGRIYASTADTKGELYVMGLGEELPTDNFYFSGTVRSKTGKKNEVAKDALANIRSRATTSIYNYCYWNSSFDPFPGYPYLNKAVATSRAMYISTGKLSSPVSIGSKQYNNISEALNAWVDMQEGNYLKWTKGAEPSFEWTFGYQIPDFMKYKNGREGKWLNTSDWAYEWMDKADKLSIIPDTLLNQDMTRGITRKEFSALAVKLYENLKGSKVEVDLTSPFTDTDDSDVIKAYSLGIVSGIGNGLFDPDAIVTREQACTMLTRVYKTVYWEGWTLEKDEQYDLHKLDHTGVPIFDDDGLISSYARDSVYFMVKNSILSGVGNNSFAPAPIADKGESYGKASREQAFKIVVAMIERFGSNETHQP